MELILIRHGTTPGNLEHRFIGVTDHPLAPQGEALARETAPKLPPVEHVYRSPLLRCEQTGRGKSYRPAVEQEQAATAETHSFLDRVYQGSVGLMMSAMARRQELSREEIAQLREILEKAEEGSEK